jgi:signal transduction histidine kinase
VARSTTDTGAEVRRLEARCRALEELVRSGEADRRHVVSRLLRAEQQERRRIASELHDDTVQVLAASLLALDRLAACTDADAIRGVAESTRRTLAAATDRTRRLMFELRPAQGLAQAVSELASHAGREADLHVEVSVPDEPVPFMVEEVAYRTVREAVSNVRRHARARRLEIALEVAGGMLRGSVRDDGRGFDPSRIGRRTHGVRLHLGIETLLERAELVGGSATVDSTPGKGTEVTFELPLTRAPIGADG